MSTTETGGSRPCLVQPAPSLTTAALQKVPSEARGDHAWHHRRRPACQNDRASGGTIWLRGGDSGTAGRFSRRLIRSSLRDRVSRTQVGVIITDSTTAPLRCGVTGMALAHSGFLALNDYVGARDVFGRPLRMTKANVADALAAAAVLVMGEGNERTPLAIITELPFVTFQNRDPSEAELEVLRIKPEDDLYAPLLQAVRWRRGAKAIRRAGHRPRR